MFQPVVDIENSIFFNPSGILRVDESLKTHYATSGKVETLIKELKEKGPLVALGQLGPTCYREDPFVLKNSFGGRSVSGWKPGTRLKEPVEAKTAIVVGARKVGDIERVYFHMSQDCAPEEKSYVRSHSISSPLYVSSYVSFSNYLIDLYPPLSVEHKHPNFISVSSYTAEELSYLHQLAAIMPLDSILDRGRVEGECKDLGQKIFDYLGREGSVKICEALKECAKDGRLRSQYVERAWDGIGNDDWRWQA